jgi:hypothetical protein
MTTRDPASGTAVFTTTLVLSWTVLTAATVMAAWTERSHSGLRMAEWASLWIFTVPVPTVQALRLRRSMAPVTGTVEAERRARTLARLGPALLLSANMALLSAFALILGR